MPTCSRPAPSPCCPSWASSPSALFDAGGIERRGQRRAAVGHAGPAGRRPRREPSSWCWTPPAATSAACPLWPTRSAPSPRSSVPWPASPAWPRRQATGRVAVLEIYADASAQVGSIGVLIVHESTARADDRAGIDSTVIYSGQYKTECGPWRRWETPARADLQAKCDKLYGMFTAAVAPAGGLQADAASGERFGGGRVLLAADALAPAWSTASGAWPRSWPTSRLLRLPGRGVGSASALAVIRDRRPGRTGGGRLPGLLGGIRPNHRGGRAAQVEQETAGDRRHATRRRRRAEAALPPIDAVRRRVAEVEEEDAAAPRNAAESGAVTVPFTRRLSFRWSRSLNYPPCVAAPPTSPASGRSCADAQSQRQRRAWSDPADRAHAAGDPVHADRPHGRLPGPARRAGRGRRDRVGLLRHATAGRGRAQGRLVRPGLQRPARAPASPAKARSWPRTHRRRSPIRPSPSWSCATTSFPASGPWFRWSCWRTPRKGCRP